MTNSRHGDDDGDGLANQADPDHRLGDHRAGFGTRSENVRSRRR